MLLRMVSAAFGLVLILAGVANADLNAYIRELNISAEGNIGGFRTQLGARFGASGPNLDLVLRSVDSPAEAAIILWIRERSRQPLESVLEVYRSQKGHGWGAVAKSLGIKPGSADFHALKQGNIGWHPDSAEGREKKNKGKNKK